MRTHDISQPGTPCWGGPWGRVARENFQEKVELELRKAGKSSCLWQGLEGGVGGWEVGLVGVESGLGEGGWEQDAGSWQLARKESRTMYKYSVGHAARQDSLWVKGV